MNDDARKEVRESIDKAMDETRESLQIPVEELMDRLALAEQLLCPGTGTCRRCKRPWICPEYKHREDGVWEQLSTERFGGKIGVRSHRTDYSGSGGMFPLCEGCWKDLKTAKARLPFYWQLWKSWNTDSPTWAQVQSSVYQEEENMRSNPNPRIITRWNPPSPRRAQPPALVGFWLAIFAITAACIIAFVIWTARHPVAAEPRVHLSTP